MLKEAIVAIALAVTSVPVFAAPCWACSCAVGSTPKETRHEQARRADLVFTGIAKSETVVDNDPSTQGDERVKTRFRVRKIYKGNPGERVTVWTYGNEAACGYDFEVGERYTVFAREQNDRFWTDLCSGTKRGRIDPDRYGLPPGRRP